MLLYLGSFIWEKLIKKLSLNSRKNLLICGIFTMDFLFKVGKSTIFYTINLFSNKNTINKSFPMNKINNFLTNRNNNKQKTQIKNFIFSKVNCLHKIITKPTTKNIAQISSFTYVKMININYFGLIIYIFFFIKSYCKRQPPFILPLIIHCITSLYFKCLSIVFYLDTQQTKTTIECTQKSHKSNY
jgi:hypothetical protein